MARPKKRAFDDSVLLERDGGEEGAFLVVELVSGKPLKSKGWPWLQACIRNVVGGKVEKAFFSGDGKLIIKTKNSKQTKQFLQAKFFDGEPVKCVLHEKMNSSRGTIYAYDLVDLGEEGVLGWLKEYGVTGVHQVKRKTREGEVGTPCFVLTFNRSRVPEDIKLDYVRYKVRPCYPKPLMCQACGRFGHREDRCKFDLKCLKCGIDKADHSDEKCVLQCANCQSKDHTYLKVDECPKYKEQIEICQLKYDQDVSFKEAERMFKERQKGLPLQTFAKVVGTRQVPAGGQPLLQPLGLDSRLRTLEEKVDRVIKSLEEKLERVVAVLLKVVPNELEVECGETRNGIGERSGAVQDGSDELLQQEVLAGSSELSANTESGDEGWTVVSGSRGRKKAKENRSHTLGGIPASSASGLSLGLGTQTSSSLGMATQKTVEIQDIPGVSQSRDSTPSRTIKIIRMGFKDPSMDRSE